MIKAIVCVDSKWGIGKQNGLLFKLEKDLQLFKQVTINNIVFFGYNTLLSFPGSKPLKGRSALCLCPKGIERDDCFCIHDFEEAVRLLKELAKTKDVFVIGGAMTYKSMLPYCQEVIVNKVKAVDPEATVFFPNMDEEKDFVISKVDKVQIDNGYETQLYVYERKPVAGTIDTSKPKLTTAMHVTEENLDLFEEALRR